MTKKTYKDDTLAILAIQLVEKRLNELGYNGTDWTTGKIPNDPFPGILKSSTYYEMRKLEATDKTVLRVLRHFGVKCGIYCEYDAEIKKD